MDVESDDDERSIEKIIQNVDEQVAANLRNDLNPKKKKQNIKLRGVDAGYKRALKTEIKKQKKLKNKIFLELKRKRPQKKEASSMQSIANQVLKKKISDPKAVVAYLASIIDSPDDRTKNIISIIASSKVYNDRIVLSDRISDKPLYTYYSTYYEKVTALTNDVLYLRMIYDTDIKAEDNFKNKDTKKAFQEFMLNQTLIESVQIISSPTNFEGTIKKGYYQDYEGQFLALNLDSLSEEDRANILNMSDPVEFEYDNFTYIASGNRTACIIIEKDKADEVKKLYANMKILKVDDGKIALGLKEVQIKSKPKFLNCKIKGEKFCPCFMILPKEINVAMFYKVKIDHNTLFNLLDEYVPRTDEIPFPNNVCYWDTLESFVDFLWVYVFTSRIIQEKNDLIEN